jgi:hypothetical protein
MADPLPDWLRDYCLLSLSPGAFLPLSAAFLAVASGIALRAAYDIRDPLPVRDPREHGRLLLQGTLTIGLAGVLFFVLQMLAGVVLPMPDRMGGLLRTAIGITGVALAVRALWRIQIAMFTPLAPPPLGADPALMIPTEADMVSTDLPLAMTPTFAAPPQTGWLRRSNVPPFMLGVLLAGFAFEGWHTSSLCLLRIPTAP